jgi:hypothetical protein
MREDFLPPDRRFRDLVPWADPYIAALVERLRRVAAVEEALDSRDVTGELPPPLDKDDRDHRWEADWSPRNWPRK